MPAFTPKQAAEILEIPPSTLRRYRSKWADYLSAPDEKRRFTDQDIDTLRVIRDLTNQRKPKADIIAALQEPIEPFIFNDTQPAPEPDQSSAIQSIEFFSQVIDQLTSEHKTAIRAQSDHIDDLRREIAQLRSDLADAKKPWWARFWA
jgi:DNA-binding transcriptional MerR regulator